MCRRNTRTLAGVCALSFSVGVIASHVFPGFIIAFVEGAALIVAGILLIKR